MHCETSVWTVSTPYPVLRYRGLLLFAEVALSRLSALPLRERHALRFPAVDRLQSSGGSHQAH